MQNINVKLKPNAQVFTRIAHIVHCTSSIFKNCKILHILLFFSFYLFLFIAYLSAFSTCIFYYLMLAFYFCSSYFLLLILITISLVSISFEDSWWWNVYYMMHMVVPNMLLNRQHILHIDFILQSSSEEQAVSGQSAFQGETIV